MATEGKTVAFKDKDYVDNEFIDIVSAPDDEYLRGDGTWQTAAYIVGVGFILNSLGDVTLTTPADDDFLIYDTATSLWKNEASSTIPASIGLGSSDSVDFGDLSLTGNLVVGGTRTILNTEVLGIVDPLITLQTAADGGSLTVDTNKDVGLGLQYFDGSAKTAFLGFDDSEAKLTFVPDATITNEVVSGAKGTIVADLEGTITAQGDTELYALSQVTSAANKGIQFTGSGTAATYDLTIAGKALLDDADAATQRLTLGLGSVATHSLSSVIAMTASQVPGYLQHLDPASVSILKSGLGTIATHSLSSVLGLLSEPRLPNYITPTTRNILKFGLGTIATHSLSSVLALTQQQIPQISTRTKLILKSGLGTAATHSLSSILGLIGEPRLPNYITPTTRNILKSGLGTIATHSLSSVLAMMSSTKSLSGMKDIDITGVYTDDIIVYDGIRWINQKPPNAAGLRALGLGTIATHSLSSVLALLGEPRLPNYISPTTRNILKTGLGTIATHSLSSVVSMMSSQVPGYLHKISPASVSILKSGLGTIATHSLSSVVAMMSSTQSISGMKDIDITNATTNDVIVYDGIRWVNQTAPTARLSLGLGSVATHSLSNILAMASGSASATYSPTTKNILKAGLGTIATHSLSSVIAMMSSTTSISGMKDIDITGVSTNDIIVYDGIRWVNQTAPTARLSLGLGSVATHSLSNVLALASGSASAKYSPATKNILKFGLGTIATHSLSSVLAMARGASPTEREVIQLIGENAQPPATDFVSKANGGTFLGDIFATNLSGTNTGDQTLPTDFVSKASGGTFLGNIDATNLSGTNTGDQTLPTDFVSKASGGTFSGGIIATSFNGTEIVAGTNSNLGVGITALNSITTGDSNVALGDNALTSCTDGYFNVATGKYAMENTTSAEQSTAIGFCALRLNETGIKNTAMGAKALRSAVTGDFNTAVGYYALYKVNGPNWNTALGFDAGKNIVGGNNNTILGAKAGDNITSGSSNIIIGFDIDADSATGSNQLNIGGVIKGNLSTNAITLPGTITASNLSGTNTGDQTLPTDFVSKASGGTFSGNITASNLSGTNTGDQTLPTDFVSKASGGTFSGGIIATSFNGTQINQGGYNGNLGVGITALDSITSGFNNSAVGDNALTSCTDGYGHAAVGTYAMENTTSANQNAAVGYCALRLNETAERNTAMGAKALQSLVTGDFNTACGYSALYDVNGATWNTALGFDAGKNIVGGNNNTILGAKAGDNITSGSSNIIIGFDIDADSATGSNQLNIGGAIKGNLSSGDITFPGKVMISRVSAGFTADSHFKLENLGDVDQDRTGILWRTRSANGGKAWFGFEKMLNYGRGDFVWFLDNAQDDGTVTTTDEMLRLRHLTGSLEPGVDNSQNLGSGSKRWNTVYGRATSANWSDLAERYEADKYYDEGTVLAIGGEKEVTEYVKGMPFAGVVSIHPGLRMNDRPEYEDDPNFPYICLTGRIPVKINGTAKKGDYIITDDAGRGKSIGKQPNVNIMHDLIGIALSNSNSEFVEVKI